MVGRVVTAIANSCQLRTETRGSAPEETDIRYRCQATDLIKAPRPVRRRNRWNPFFYVRDVTSGNISVGDLLWFGLRAAGNAFTTRWFGWRLPRVQGTAVGV